MSGKRPEGRSPEANILASPKYSKTLPSAASEPPVSPSGPKSRTEPLTTIAVLPRTAHRRGRFRKERKPQPDRKRPRLRSGKRTRLSYRSGDRRTTGPDPRDTVRPPRPARHTPETSRRNALRRCPFHKYPKRLPFPTEERPPHRTRETPRRPPRHKRPAGPKRRGIGMPNRSGERIPRPMHKTGTRPADGLPLRRTFTRSATEEGACPDVRRSPLDRHPVKTTFLPHPRDKREVRKERRPSRGKFPSGRSPVTAPR